LPPGFARPLCVACAFGNAMEGAVHGVSPGESAGSGQGLKTGAGASAGAGGREEFTVQSFGDYELLEEIGRGGMGVVYRARQRSLNRIVAVKRILPGAQPHPSTIHRFHAEAEAAARLRHRGIVGIHEIGEHEGQPFFCMEFVDGQPMSALMRDGPHPARQVGEYLLKIAEAVDYAHQQGVVHRDLKPSNILIDHSGEPLVTDFGLAKRQWADADLTLSGQVLGTPSFMAPEQASFKEGEVGSWSDIYSLGAILYCLLTGRPPFQAASTEAIIDTLRVEWPSGIVQELHEVAIKQTLEITEPARLSTKERGKFESRNWTGLGFYVQASEDLVSWSSLGDFSDHDGWFVVEDTDTETLPQRFYRAASKPASTADIFIAAGVTVGADGATVVPVAADPATPLYYRRFHFQAADRDGMNARQQQTSENQPRSRECGHCESQ
jgi:serine/threonine protein kinase